MWYNIAMNGYDFDDTIYKGNSMCRFSIFCTLRLPYLILFTPVLLLAVFLRGLRILNKNRYLHLISLYVALVPHAERFASKFWDRNMSRIKGWYLKERRDDDVVISASPHFLVAEACKRLGVNCIATDLSPKNAKLNREHCYGKQKVVVYKEVYGDAPLATYYSDSLSDTPMFKFADKGYFVCDDEVVLLYENGQKILPCNNKRQLREYIRAQNK